MNLSKFNIVITGNPMIDSMILRGVMLLATAWAAGAVEWLEAEGFHDPHLGQLVTAAIAGGILVVVVLVAEFIKKRADLVQAVQAGINLTVSGAAVSASGAPILVSAPQEPVKTVTAASAKVIIANYGGR